LLEAFSTLSGLVDVGFYPSDERERERWRDHLWVNPLLDDCLHENGFPLVEYGLGELYASSGHPARTYLENAKIWNSQTLERTLIHSLICWETAAFAPTAIEAQKDFMKDIVFEFYDEAKKDRSEIDPHAVPNQKASIGLNQLRRLFRVRRLIRAFPL
jgi:hypothetical protein